MKDYLKKAVKIFESIDLQMLEARGSINPEIIMDINEFLDDYYAEISLLNENFIKVIHNDFEGYDCINAVRMPAENTPEIKYTVITVMNTKSGRTYTGIYRYEAEELIIIDKFKED